MKNTLILLTLTLLFFAFKNKENSTTVKVKDSIITSKTNELKETVHIQTIKNCNQSFEEFFEQFAKDSLFQKSRVKYPLKESYYEDLESSEITIEMVSKSDYHYLDFTEDQNAMNREYSQYKIVIEKIDENNIYYRNVGIDNGINIIYKFKLIDRCWFMIEIEDKST